MGFGFKDYHYGLSKLTTSRTGIADAPGSARMQQPRGHAGLGRMAQSERDFDKYAAEWRHAGERWRGPVLSGVGGRFC